MPEYDTTLKFAHPEQVDKAILMLIKAPSLIRWIYPSTSGGEVRFRTQDISKLAFEAFVLGLGIFGSTGYAASEARTFVV